MGVLGGLAPGEGGEGGVGCSRTNPTPHQAEEAGPAKDEGDVFTLEKVLAMGMGDHLEVCEKVAESAAKE